MLLRFSRVAGSGLSSYFFLSVLRGKYYGQHWEHGVLQHVARILQVTLCKLDRRFPSGIKIFAASQQAPRLLVVVFHGPNCLDVTRCCATPFSARLRKLFVLEQKLTRTFGTVVIFNLAFCLLLQALVMMIGPELCLVRGICYPNFETRSSNPVAPLVSSFIKHSIIVR